MIEILVEIAKELNVSVHNLIYFFFGVFSCSLLKVFFRREEPLLFLYNNAVDLYNSLKEFMNKDSAVLQLYNSVIIRAICILALDGSFSGSDFSFIQRALSKAQNLEQSQKDLTQSMCSEFLSKIVDFEKQLDHGKTILFSLLKGRRK